MAINRTPHLKKAFLESFSQHGNISAAARAAGIDRTTVYLWQEKDEEFVQQFRVAEIEATEHLEHAAYDRAVNGVKNEKGVYFRDELIATETEIKYSDTLLIFLLKARAPDKYRDNQHVTHSGSIDFGTIGELLQGRDARAR